MSCLSYKMSAALLQASAFWGGGSACAPHTHIHTHLVMWTVQAIQRLTRISSASTLPSSSSWLNCMPRQMFEPVMRCTVVRCTVMGCTAPALQLTGLQGTTYLQSQLVQDASVERCVEGTELSTRKHWIFCTYHQPHQ